MSEQRKRTQHNSIRLLTIDGVIFALALLLDQWVKQRIRVRLPEREHFDLIEGVLQIYHHENGGSAFGLLQGQTVFFIVSAIVVLLVIVYLLYTIPPEKKYIILNVALSLVLAGAVGNTIDRVMKATVTDFIYVVLIDFPIFNIADMYIVTATILILILVIFVYRDEDLQFVDFGRTKDTRPVKRDDG